MDYSAAILLSRQARGACGRSVWIRQTRAAIEALRTRDIILNSSIGMRTWDLITVLGFDAGLRVRLFVPVGPGEDEAAIAGHVAEQFKPQGRLESIIPIQYAGRSERSNAMRLRDRRIIEQSMLLLPVSLRPRGTMERWLGHLSSDQQCDQTFRIVYELDRTLGAIDLSKRRVNPEIDRLTEGFLFHWTRTIDHPWPDETIAAYCRAIATSATYPRTAGDTLIRIAVSQQLLASRRHMPGNIPTVSFTSLPPSNTIPLMRWRARFGEMSFEPYAVGVRRSVADAAGVRPVYYYDGKAVDSTIPCWLTQSRGKVTDWTTEREWRVVGNLDLAQFESDDLLVIVQHPDEIGPMEKASGLRTLALFESD